MGIDQIVIMITGVLAAWVNQDRNDQVRRWAGVIGMVGQPFWLCASARAGQWGMFAVSVGYTVAFIRGIFSRLGRPCDGATRRVAEDLRWSTRCRPFGVQFDEAISFLKDKLPEASVKWDDLAGPVACEGLHGRWRHLGRPG